MELKATRYEVEDGIATLTLSRRGGLREGVAAFLEKREPRFGGFG